MAAVLQILFKKNCLIALFFPIFRQNTLSVLISCCDHLCPQSLSNFDIFIYVLLFLMFSAKLQVHGVENSSSKWARMMTGSISFRIIQVILSDGPGSLNLGFSATRNL